MFDTARISSTPAKNEISRMFMIASTVMAKAGTRCLLRRPSWRIVIPSFAIPYSAREPSIVAVFIDSTSPATTQKIITPPRKFPTIASNACVYQAISVASSAIAAVPSVPPAPSGSRMYTSAENSAADRSAIRVSRCVSWYSGANVATTSIPYDDQHMKYSHTSASASPPLAPICHSMFELDQSPVTYGRNISTNAGMQRSAPVTYANQTAGRTPRMLNTQTRTIRPMPMTIGRLMSNPAPLSTHVESENHSAWISVPATSPLTASTTDQPIQ